MARTAAAVSGRRRRCRLWVIGTSFPAVRRLVACVGTRVDHSPADIGAGRCGRRRTAPRRGGHALAPQDATRRVPATGLAALYWTCSPTNARSLEWCMTHDLRTDNTDAAPQSITPSNPDAPVRIDVAMPRGLYDRLTDHDEAPAAATRRRPDAPSSLRSRGSATSGGPGSSRPSSAGSSRCSRMRAVRWSSWWRARADC